MVNESLGVDTHVNILLSDARIWLWIWHLFYFVADRNMVAQVWDVLPRVC